MQEREAPTLIDVMTPLGVPLDTLDITNFAFIIATHPDVRVVLAHCTSDLDSERIEWYTRGGFDNTYLDLSGEGCLKFYRDSPLAKRELMVWRLREFGLERVFFGSDYLMVSPVATPNEALETLTKYPFTQAEVDLITSNDGSNWLFGQ